MVNIKLHYFNLRGRAEAARWIMEYAGVAYEDIRMEREEWPEKKSSRFLNQFLTLLIHPTTFAEMLTGKVPQLEYDGFVLSETGAIVAFLGTQLKLAGDSNQDQATCHMVVDLVLDYLGQMGKIRFEEDPERRKKLTENLEEKVAPAFFATMIQLLQKNGGKHFVGSKVSIATT